LTLSPADRTVSVVNDNGNGDISAFKYLKVSNATAANSAIFTHVVWPEAAVAKPTERVAIGNCSGTIITDGNYKYLALFSNNGSPVNAQIELGGSYQGG